MKNSSKTSTNNSEKYLGISKKDIPDILLASKNINDPNLQDVSSRDMLKYLKEQYWIKQWSPSNRWERSSFISAGGHTSLRLRNLGHDLDDPGDAFLKLFLSADTFLFSRRVSVCIWVEVTEAIFPEDAKKLNQFMQEYNGLRVKSTYNREEYIKSFVKASAHSGISQYKMANRVIDFIKRKAEKGKEGGSYQQLVSDYGTGALIIGIPLWFATPPINPNDPLNALYNFYTRLKIGLNEIKHSVLNTKLCPFDSIYIVWNPNIKSIDSWVQTANTDFYSNQANISLEAFLALKTHSLLKNSNADTISFHVRHDRYKSLNSAIRAHNKLFHLSKYPKPFGPKACLKITQEDRLSIKKAMGNWALLSVLKTIVLFVLIRHNYKDLRKWITNYLSPAHLLQSLYQKHKMKKMYYSEPSDKNDL